MTERVENKVAIEVESRPHVAECDVKLFGNVCRFAGSLFGLFINDRCVAYLFGLFRAFKKPLQKAPILLGKRGEHRLANGGNRRIVRIGFLDKRRKRRTNPANFISTIEHALQ